MWGTLLVIGSLVAALYLYSQKPEDKGQSEAWYEGYEAGFLTPGPFTIIGIMGAGYLVWKRSY